VRFCDERRATPSCVTASRRRARALGRAGRAMSSAYSALSAPPQHSGAAPASAGFASGSGGGGFAGNGGVNGGVNGADRGGSGGGGYVGVSVGGYKASVDRGGGGGGGGYDSVNGVDRGGGGGGGGGIGDGAFAEPLVSGATCSEERESRNARAHADEANWRGVPCGCLGETPGFLYYGHGDDRLCVRRRCVRCWPPCRCCEHPRCGAYSLLGAANLRHRWGWPLLALFLVVFVGGEGVSWAVELFKAKL